jgi:hypothetical protein
MLQERRRQYVCFQEMKRVGGATDMGAKRPRLGWPQAEVEGHPTLCVIKLGSTFLTLFATLRAINRLGGQVPFGFWGEL